MLSLLSLFLTSGTVLRVDTEEWTSDTYPNPLTNHTLCNTSPNSYLCDPDHILTDNWRAIIQKTIEKQMQRLAEVNTLYTEDTPDECYENSTEPIKIYLILARRIKTSSNHTFSETDLVEFGDGIAENYNLSSQICKNFIIIIGVEQVKLAYVRTGVNLYLPEDLMKRIFKEYSDLFNAKNYMETLNEVINNIGDEIIEFFKNATPPTRATTELTSVITNIPIIQVHAASTLWWILSILGITSLLALVSLILLILTPSQPLFSFRGLKYQLQKLRKSKNNVHNGNGTNNNTLATKNCNASNANSDN